MRGKLSAFLICLAISAFLWISHRLNQTYFYSINVPVKFVNLPANKALINELPDHLRFDIKTNGLKLFFVLLRRPFNEITIDFNKLKSDNKQQAYSISSGNIKLSETTKLNVDVKRISPDTLFFVSKTGITKNVAVKAIISANPEKGYVLSKPVISPAFITINGDSISVNGIDSISTAPLYLNQVNANYNGQLALLRPSENVFLNINEVNISIKADKLLEKQIEVPLTALGIAPSTVAKLFPSKVKITYSAARNDFSEISSDDFKAVVNYSKHHNNKMMVELSTVPTQAKILSIEPTEVEFLLFKTK
ncbi:MAG: YbbR-like domain-containing protein [Bacteroidetes bacterium]|nr:YbbR-like domain-containing protein [Bacteroidota bacterium]